MIRLNEAKLIEKYSTNSALYECSPPMKFIKRTEHLVAKPEIIESNLVVIHNCSIAEGFDRTVIHLAERLQGDEGVAYGREEARLLDGVSQHSEALALSGYKLAA